MIIINLEEKGFILKHLYTVEDYLTFNIKVKSGEFSGASNFCLLNKDILSIIDKLSNMKKDLKGHCELKDSDSDSYILIQMEKHGHLFISGQVGGSHEDHVMKFKYMADQTILIEFIEALKNNV